MNLVLAAALALVPAPLGAQDPPGSDPPAGSWRLNGLRDGFCVQALLDPATLAREIPDRVKLLRADGVELHPALRMVLANQPEYAGWTPSTLCVYVFQTVDVGSGEVVGGDPTKPPVLAFWTVAAMGPGGNRRDLALAVLTSSGRLDDAAHDVSLDPDRLHYYQGPVPREDGPPRPDETRYRLKIGKTTLTWDGHESDDTTASPSPTMTEWIADGEHGRWVSASLTVTPASERPMVGSLWVEGKDLLARALQGSPTRFVGPLLSGGSAEMGFDY